MSNPLKHLLPTARRRRASLPAIVSMVVLALVVAACGGSAAEPTAAPANTPIAAAPADTPTSAPPTATSAPPTATLIQPTATAEPAPTDTPTKIPPTATSVPPTATAAPEPTAEPEPTEQPEPTEAPLPAPTVDNSALIAQGRSVFEANGCAGCHGEPGAQGIISPNLAGIATRAASRVAGLSAEAYIRQSIQDPNAFIVPDCPPGPCPRDTMPQTFGASLSAEQLTALVTYLLSLN